MMLRIACTCGHTGLVSAETLPRSLTCSACGRAAFGGPEPRPLGTLASRTVLTRLCPRGPAQQIF